MQSISVLWESIKYCLASFICLFLFVQLICGKLWGKTSAPSRMWPVTLPQPLSCPHFTQCPYGVYWWSCDCWCSCILHKSPSLSMKEEWCVSFRGTTKDKTIQLPAAAKFCCVGWAGWVGAGLSRGLQCHSGSCFVFLFFVFFSFSLLSECKCLSLRIFRGLK